MFPLADPFAVQAPDSVESILDNAAASCIEFNHGPGLFAGQYLASGRSDGYVAIWDIETKGLVRWLEGHVKTVTSVKWVVVLLLQSTLLVPLCR